MSLNGACLGIFDKIQQSEKEFEGSKGNFQKRRLRLMYNLKLCVTFKKLNIITGREKIHSIYVRIDAILAWYDNFLSFSNKTFAIS